MPVMNRRDFTKSLTAAALLPALPSSAAFLPARSDFWIRYLTGLHGTATPAHVARFNGAAIARTVVAGRTAARLRPRMDLRKICVEAAKPSTDTLPDDA